MRQIFELLNGSPQEHHRKSGSICSVETVMPAKGFTAVNDLDRRQHSSLETMPAATTEPLGPSHGSMISKVAKEDQQSTRKSDTRNDSVLCPESSVKQSPGTMKRKRSIADTIEQPLDDDMAATTALSSKRRVIDAENAAHSSTPENPSAGSLNGDRMSMRATLDLTNRDRCSREQSPVPTRNQRVAPPQVRPETQAHLAESLATHLQDIYKSSSKNDPEAPAATSQAESPKNTYSPEDVGVDSSGKRKRNFSNRTKTGCHTCRQRKKKCDEAKPECKNCTRGNHPCAGYGPKPLNYKGPNAARTHIPLQSKAQDTPRRSPTPDEQDTGPRYDHWGRIPPAPGLQEHHHRLPSSRSPNDMRRSSRDSWSSQSWQNRPESSQPYGTMPPSAGYSQAMPLATVYPNHPFSPPYEPLQTPFPPYRPNTGVAMTVSSRDSSGTHSSHSQSHHYFPSSQISEQEKMILGKPYLAFIDNTLLDDRKQCKLAVERFNGASNPSQDTSVDERGRLFAAILDPAQRSAAKYDYRPSIPPKATFFNRPGRVGHRVIVEAPFKCDYGYNIEIGDDVVISAGCYIKDPCEILIGHRVYVAENVQFCGNVASLDPSKTKGSQGCLVGGSIIVEDDVDIGARAVIMPHRIIGKGSSVAAGSVVTRNVPPYTEVAGVPACVVRSLPRPGESSDETSGIDKDIIEENERSIREMRARRGVREQGK